MSKIVFEGRISPPLRIVTLGHELRDVCMTHPDPSQTIKLSMRIVESRITVSCETSEINDGIRMAAHSGACNLANSAANILAFRHGFLLSAAIETASVDGGPVLPINRRYIEVEGLCTSFTDDDDRFGNLLLTIGSGPLMLVMNDLIESIRTPYSIALNCGRAIESIRHLIAPTKERSQAWEEMCSALNLDRTYVEALTKHSIPARHGEHIFLSAVIQAMLL